MPRSAPSAAEDSAVPEGSEASEGRAASEGSEASEGAKRPKEAKHPEGSAASYPLVVVEALPTREVNGRRPGAEPTRQSEHWQRE